MTRKQRQIAALKNKLEHATTQPDPIGQICEGLRREIAILQMDDAHMYCAIHGVQERAHPYYHDQGIQCAACASERGRDL